MINVEDLTHVIFLIDLVLSMYKKINYRFFKKISNRSQISKLSWLHWVTPKHLFSSLFLMYTFPDIDHSEKSSLFGEFLHIIFILPENMVLYDRKIINVTYGV